MKQIFTWSDRMLQQDLHKARRLLDYNPTNWTYFEMRRAAHMIKPIIPVQQVLLALEAEKQSSLQTLAL